MSRAVFVDFYEGDVVEVRREGLRKRGIVQGAFGSVGDGMARIQLWFVRLSAQPAEEPRICSAADMRLVRRAPRELPFADRMRARRAGV